MFDPCCEPLTPGWPLRNMLLLAAVRWGVRALKVVCVRDSSAGRTKAERCFVLEVRQGAKADQGVGSSCHDVYGVSRKGTERACTSLRAAAFAMCLGAGADGSGWLEFLVPIIAGSWWVCRL
jgi:hypothetical protein